MADAIEQRDFFISFNSADLPYAEAIDAALREAGLSTFFHPNDLPDGGNIIIWMDEALMNSAQTLALFSPDYTKDKAAYSKIERYASLWQDPGSDERKLIPVLLRETAFTPLIAPIKRIDVTGMTRHDAAARVVIRLKTPLETQERNRWRVGLPLPKVFNVLYRRNPNFTGRLEAMESLQNSLRDGNAAVTAVAGMGGVGKTTLAAEYCHFLGGRYGGVWWVRAEQEPVMLADLAALGQRLGLASTNNIEADVHAALENLASRTEPWLMVYDNAPNADSFGKWLPAGTVRCLITSRFTGFDGIATVTQLDQWSDDVTADYLLVRTGRDDKEGALGLAHALGGLPLAAEQAAVFLKNRRGISFEDYAKEIARLIKEEMPPGAKGGYPDTVYAAFVKSLEAIDRMLGGKTALDLVRLCAFLSPDGVDLALIAAKSIKDVLPADFAAAMADKFTREEALAALTSLSLLRQEDGPAGSVLIFHRLLLQVARDWMGSIASHHWGSVAEELINAVFPGDVGENPSSWPVSERLMPHVAPLDAYAPRTGSGGRGLGRLLNQAGLYLDVRGDRTGALAMAVKAVALGRETEAENPLNIAAALSNLASRYLDLKQLEKAEVAFREALSIKEAHLDTSDPSRAITMSNFAQLLLERKAFAEAETLFLGAAEIHKVAHGAESLDYGRALANLGSLYGNWADETADPAQRAQAERYLTQAVAVVLRTSGPRHPAAAISHFGLGTAKAYQNNWSGAAAETEMSLAVQLSLDLGKHPDTQVTAQTLAYYWQRNGQSEKAARLQRGDISDLLSVVGRIEEEHRAWVAEDPRNRHFGPQSPFAKKLSAEPRRP